MRLLKRKIPVTIITAAIVFSIYSGCAVESGGKKIAVALGVKDNPESPFYLPLKELQKLNTDECKNLPVGVFDSGTGGLTVLEKMLENDEFDNTAGEKKAGGDGIPDLSAERFVYLGDAANMPYGNYPSENNIDFLKELAVKDVLFLLNMKYNHSADVVEVKPKPTVKIIVIACNTATAYGKSTIEEVIDYLGLDIDVIGVIDAGVEGALEYFTGQQSGTIAVMATVGTVLSESYPATVKRKIKETAYPGTIDIVQQGGFGLAGAIDGDRSYCARNGIKMLSAGSIKVLQ